MYVLILNFKPFVSRGIKEEALSLLIFYYCICEKPLGKVNKVCMYVCIVLVGDASCRLSSLQPSLVTVSGPGCRLSNFTQSGPQNRHTDDVTGKLCCLFLAIWRTVLCMFVHFS